MNPSGFRVLLWDLARQIYCGDFNLHGSREFYLGRHEDNALRVDHPDLALFHWVLCASDEALEILTLPGAHPLVPLERWSQLGEKLRTLAGVKPPNQRSTNRRAAYRCAGLVLEVIPPGQIFRPRMRLTGAAGPITNGKSRRTPVAVLILMLGCLLGFTYVGVDRSAGGTASSPQRSETVAIVPTPFAIQTPSTVITRLHHQDMTAELSSPALATTSLYQAKALFRSGKEEAALAVLFHEFSKQGATQRAKRAGDLAKEFYKIQQLRRSIIATDGVQWDRLQEIQEIEKSQLGGVTNQTSEILTETLSRFEAKGEVLYQSAYSLQSANPERARRLLNQSLSYFPRGSLWTEKVRALLAQLP